MKPHIKKQKQKDSLFKGKNESMLHIFDKSLASICHVNPDCLRSILDSKYQCPLIGER